MALLPDGPTASRAAWTPPPVGHAFALRGWCGMSFNRGLVHFHDLPAGQRATDRTRRVFGHVASGLVAFAVDWRGRQICARPDHDGGMAMVADISTARLSTLARMEDLRAWLLDDDECDDADQLFGPSAFRASLRHHRLTRLRADRCFGYRVPPCLGGPATPDNLVPTRTEDYWRETSDVLLRGSAPLPQPGPRRAVVLPVL